MEDNRLRLGARKLTSSTFNLRDDATTNSGASDRKQKAAEYNQYIKEKGYTDLYNKDAVKYQYQEQEQEKTKDKDTSWWAKGAKIMSVAANPVLGGLANSIQDLYRTPLVQATVEKAVETNITSLKGDILKNEVKNLNDFAFVKDYETRRQQAYELAKQGDEEGAQKIWDTLSQDFAKFDQITKSNKDLISMYYKVPKVGGATYSEKKYAGPNLLGELTDRTLALTNSNIRLAGKAKAPKDVTSVNVSNIPLWNRFTIALDNILSFNNSAEEISEYVNKGYGDAVNFVRNEEVSNNPDRSGIIAKLDQLEKDNVTSHDVKTQKLRDKQEVLRNGSWFFDPESIDPVFREKVNNNEFQWTEPRSYLYALPQIGSSMGEFATTVETASLGRLAGIAAKALGRRGIPYASAAVTLTEAAINASNQYYQRTQETNAEIFDSYLSNLVGQMENGNINPETILTKGAQGLEARGINVQELTVPQILEEMLVYNINTDDPSFEKAKYDAYLGLHDVEQSNMALGLWDLMDMGLYSYGGKLAIKSAKEGFKDVAKGISKATGVTKALSLGGKFIDNRMNKALYTIAGKDVFKANKYKDLFSTMGKMSGKLGITAFSEGTEEGQQYLIQKDYQLQNTYNSGELTLIDAFLKNFKYGAEANLALMGLHPDDALNNDKELEQNMKIGSLIGLVMGGSGVAISDGYQMIRDVKSNNMLRNMAAYDISNRENDVKVDRWFDAVKKGYTNDILGNLLDIKDRFTPEGLTQEDIDEDIVKAKTIESIYYNPSINTNLEDLKINKGSDKHKVFVKNAIKAYDNERIYNEKSEEAETNLQNLLKSNDEQNATVFNSNVDEYWDGLTEEQKQSWNNSKAELIAAIKKIRNLTITQTVYSRLRRQLKDMDKFISEAKKNGLDVTNENIAAIASYVNKKSKSLEKEVKKIPNAKAMVDIFGLSTNKEIDQAIADVAILTGLLHKAVNRKSAYQNGIVVKDSQNRQIDFNIRNWNQLTLEEQQSIIDKQKNEAEQNGKDVPSLASIIAKYNYDVQQQINTQNETVRAARDYANEIIKADMDRYEQNDRSYTEQNAALNAEVENALNTTTEQQGAETDFTPTGEADSTSPLQNKDLSVKKQEKQEKRDDKDIYTQTEGDKLVSDKEQVDEEELDVTDLVSTEDAPDTSDEQEIIREKAMREMENPSEKKPKDDTQDKITEENIMDAKNWADPEDDLGLTRDDNPDIERDNTQIEDLTPKELDAKIQEAESTDSRSDNPQAGDFFVSNDGKMFLNGVEITDEQLAKENSFDEYANDPEHTLSEKANKLAKDGENVPGLSTSETIRNNWLVGRTLFYRPDATQPMQLPFKVKGAKKLHSGKELGEAMGKPGFLDGAKLYLVPGPTFDKSEIQFDPNDPRTYENAAVYVIIDKDGDIYAAAYRSQKKATLDYQRRLGAENIGPGTKANEDLEVLREQKQKVVRAYLQQCPKDKNGKYVLPDEALTHVVPTQVNVSNGVFNNQKDGNKPKLRKLSECKTFEIPHNPLDIFTECTFGYGTGGMSDANPYFIKHMGNDEALYTSGGFSGKVVIVPKPSATPRGRYSLPIYLSEKFFRDDKVTKPSQIVLKSHDEKGNPASDRHYSNFMEYVLDLITDGDPYGVLPLIVNQGPKTRLSSKKQEAAQYLAKKQLGFDPDTNRFYIALPNSQRGGLYFRTEIPLEQIKTEPNVRKMVIWFMMQNFHWNTDKNVLTSSLPEQLRDLAIRLNPKNDKIVLFPGELEFTLQQLGISRVDGKLVKDKVAPPAMAWTIDSGKLLTDMGDYAFKDGFIYIEDITTDKTETAVTVSTQPISKKSSKEAETKSVAEKGTKFLGKKQLRNILQKYRQQIDSIQIENWGIEQIAEFEEYLGKHISTDRIEENGNTITKSIFEKGSIVHATNKQSDYITQFFDDSNKPLGEPLVNLAMNSKLAMDLLKKDSNGVLSLSDESIRKIFTHNATEQTTEEKTESKPARTDKANRRAKAQELAKNIKPSDATAPKVGRFMTSDEIKEYAGSLNQKVATDSFVYLYDQDGKPQMFIRSMMEKLLQEVGREVNGLYSVEGNEVDRVEQDLKAAKTWLMEKLGLSVDQVRIFNGVMRSASNGPRVYGVTRMAVGNVANILLGKGAGLGIQYHEAWHYINMLVHSAAERQIIYEDFVKRNPEYKNRTVNEIEEAMAEDFRNWAIVENAKWFQLGYQTIKAFRAIKGFVKSLFGISNNLTENIYRNINKGKYKEYQMNQSSIDEFNKAYTEKGVYFSIPGVDQDRLKDMPSIINPDVFYNVVDSLTSTLLSIFNIRKAQDIENLSQNLDYLPSIIESNMMAGITPEQNDQLIEEVLDNWDIFKQSMVEQLSSLNIKAVEVEEKSDYDTGEKRPDEKYDRVSYEFSKKLNMSFNAKLFFYSIPKMEYDKSRKLVPVTDPIFGLNMTESFDVTWNKIMENLWDIERWEDLENRCARLGKADPFFISLLNYISGANKPDENTCTQILTTIKSAKNEMTTVQFQDAFQKVKTSAALEEYVRDIKTTVRAKAGEWRVIDSAIFRYQNKYPRQWGRLFYVSGMIDKSDVNNFVIDSEKLNNLEIRLEIIADELSEIAQPFINKKIKGSNKLSEDQIRQTAVKAKEDFVEILNSIGIDVDTKTIDYLLYGTESLDKKLPTVESFDKLYTILRSTKKGSARNQIIGNLNKLQEGESRDLKLDNPFPAAEGSFIQKLAIAHGKSHPNPSEFSVTGPNNTTIYPITQNNYMSDRVRWFNQDASEVNKTLLATYNKHSLLLGALKQGSKLSLSTLIAVRNADNRDSRDYFQISPTEDYIAKLTLAHQNRIVMPTMADKKTWYSITGVNLFHDLLSRSRMTEVQTENGIQQLFVEDDMYRYSDNTLQAISDYLLDEFNAVYDYYIHKSEVEENPNLRIDNYHGKIKNGVMDNSGNGGYFRYFSSLKMRQEDGTYKYVPLNQMLWAWSKFDYDNGGNQMETRLKQLRNTLFGNKEVLFDAINATLQDKVQEEITFLVDKGIIRRDGRDLENVLLPTNIVKEYTDKSKNLTAGDTSRNNKSAAVYSIIANHVVNEMVSINEIEKAFVGDPAYYKWKRDKNKPWIIVERSVDKIKRLGSVLSTGDNLRTFWGDGDVRNNSKFTVLHMSDNMVKSVKFDEYRKMFTSAEVMKYLQRKNPNISQRQLINMVSKDNINKTLKTIDAKSRKSIEDSVERQIAAYGVNKRGEGNINQADAAVYIRPALYRRIIQAVGEWSPEVETAFDLLESDNQEWLSDPKQYTQALETLIKPLKMVYFGNHNLTKLGLNIPVFDKMAIFPLFRVMAKADNYHLYQRMNNEELGAIDMLTFESAVKVGGRQKFTPYKDADNSRFNIEDLNRPSTSTVIGETNYEGLDTDNSKLPTYIQDLRNLRLQMNTDPHESVDRSLGTQFAKVALSNLIKDRPYGINKNVEYTGRQIIDNIFGAINRLSDIGAQKIYDEFLEDGRPSEQKLSKFLISQGKSSGLSRDALSSFEIDKTTGQIKVPLSAQSNRRFVESRIISRVGKTAIDINTPGGSAIQHAFFGFKDTTGVREQYQVGRAFNDGKPLNPLNDDGSMDCMLSTNFFKHIVPKKYASDYTTMRDWLLDKKIIGQDAKPFALGYRIPTQGLSSTCSLKVTDVLPESMGDVIVVPDDFTAMTGSDFDIDKLYIATGYYDKDGNYLQCNWDDLSSNSEKQLVNGLIDMYRVAISDDSNIDQSRAPLDNLTTKVKEEIVPLVMGETKEECKPMYELLPSYQLFKKFEYTGGKDGIAPFALASTNHALTQALNLRMDLGSVGDTYNLGNINDIVSQDGERILDWLSAMINAHVDVAKDPYIINLNVNSVTYSMTEFLLRTGKGEVTFYFLSQPILKDFANTLIKLNGQYGVDPNDVSYSELMDDTLYDLKKQYKEEAEEYISTLPKEEQKKLLNILNNWDDKDKGVDKSLAVDPLKLEKSLKNNIKGERDLDFYIQQLLVADAYSRMLPYAERLAKLVRLSQIDTKKYGNTLSQQANYSKQVFDFIRKEGEQFYQVDDKGSIIEGDDVNALMNYYVDSFLMKKLTNAVDIPRNILSSSFLQATDMYSGMFVSLANTIVGDRSNMNKQVATKLDSIIDSIIRSRIANSIEEMHLDDGEYARMVLGDWTVPKRLFQFKSAIRKNDNGKYSSMLTGDGTINNSFLNYLVPTVATDLTDTDSITLLNNSMSNSANFENRLIAYFSDLLQSDNEAVRKFAKRLAKYAFYTSYDNKSPNSFAHLISSQYRLDTGYADEVRKTIHDMNEGSWLNNILSDIDEPTLSKYTSLAMIIARNNAHDYEIVKNVTRPKSNSGNSSAFIYETAPWNDESQYLVSFATKSRKDERDFVAIDYPQGSSRNTVLYVKAGRVEAYDKKKAKKLGQATQTIYVAIPRLGRTKGSVNLSEYFKDYNQLSDFSENNIKTMTGEQVIEYFGDHEKFRLAVKGSNFSDIDITFLPSQYITDDFTFTKDPYNQELNNTKPTLENDVPKTVAMESKKIDKEVAAESGLLNRDNLMNKVKQQLLITQTLQEADIPSNPLSQVESSGLDITGMFTTEDDITKDNFSDEAFKICKSK